MYRQKISCDSNNNLQRIDNSVVRPVKLFPSDYSSKDCDFNTILKFQLSNEFSTMALSNQFKDKKLSPRSMFLPQTPVDDMLVMNSEINAINIENSSEQPAIYLGARPKTYGWEEDSSSSSSEETKDDITASGSCMHQSNEVVSKMDLKVFKGSLSGARSQSVTDPNYEATAHSNVRKHHDEKNGEGISQSCLINEILGETKPYQKKPVARCLFPEAGSTQKLPPHGPLRKEPAASVKIQEKTVSSVHDSIFNANEPKQKKTTRFSFLADYQNYQGDWTIPPYDFPPNDTNTPKNILEKSVNSVHNSFLNESKPEEKKSGRYSLFTKNSNYLGNRSIPSYNSSKNTTTPGNSSEKNVPSACNSLSNGGKPERKKTARYLFSENSAYQGDWTIPPYDFPLNSTVTFEKSPEKISVSVQCVSTQTLTDDFVCSYKVDKNYDFDPIYPVLTSRKKDHSKEKDVVLNSLHLQEQVSSAHIAKFEKSSCTEDISVDIETPKKLKHLAECCPHIASENLKYFLDLCCGDVEWTLNLLLDSESWNLKDPLTSNCYSDQESDNACLDKSNVEFNLAKTDKTEAQCETDNLLKPLLQTNSFQNSSENSPSNLDLEFSLKLRNHFGSGESDDQDQKSSMCAIKNDSQVPLSKRGPTPLTEIMDMEYAIKLYKEEKLDKDVDLEIRNKRKKLYDLFPGADPTILDTVFEDTNFCLDSTVFVLGEDPASLINKESVKNSPYWVIFPSMQNEWGKEQVSKQATSANDMDNGTNGISNGLGPNHWLNRVDNDAKPRNVASSSGSIPSKAQELRDLASKHYARQQEQSHKAADAYQRGLPGAAAYYAQEARKEKEKRKKMQKEAAEIIFDDKNQFHPDCVIDLHGLVVKEAIRAVTKFLNHHLRSLENPTSASNLTVLIITGQGNHTKNKRSKLQSSVRQYLSKFKCSYLESGGTFKVHLGINKQSV